MDRESGIATYEVALVGDFGACGHPHSDGYMGRVIARETYGCMAEATFEARVSAQLVHGERYRCAVTATNNAGLSASASSSDIIVDLATAVMGLGENLGLPVGLNNCALFLTSLLTSSPTYSYVRTSLLTSLRTC